MHEKEVEGKAALLQHLRQSDFMSRWLKSQLDPSTLDRPRLSFMTYTWVLRLLLGKHALFHMMR
jgi:hypothetical protein